VRCRQGVERCLRAWPTRQVWFAEAPTTPVRPAGPAPSIGHADLGNGSRTPSEIATAGSQYADVVTRPALLFDPSTNRLTGLIHFDFGQYIASRRVLLLVRKLDAHRGAAEHRRPRHASLRSSLIHGLLEEPPKQGGEAVYWKLAAIVDRTFGEVGVKRPSKIAGIDELSVLYWFIQDISPPMFFLKCWRSRAKLHVIEMIRAGA